MKKMILMVAVLALMLMPARAWAMPSDKFTAAWAITVNELGDAKIDITFRYDAQTYAVWQRKYGLNPSLLRRDLGKYLTPYEVPANSFKVNDQNKMDREITVSLVAKGYMTCKNDDIWQTEMPKKYQKNDRVANHYTFFGASKMDDGRVMEETIQLVLPMAATDFSEDKDERGNTTIRYKLVVAGDAGMASRMVSGPGSFGIPKLAWFATAGVLAFLGFIFLVLGVVIRDKRPVVVTA